MKKRINQIKLILEAISKSNQALKNKKFAGLLPFFWGLIAFSLLMVFINAVSPLAPFVYSLF